MTLYTTLSYYVIIENVSSITHEPSEGTVVTPALIKKVGESLARFDLTNAITNLTSGLQKNNPTGLVVGDIGENLGMGYRTEGYFKADGINIYSSATAGISADFNGLNPNIAARIVAEKNLGKGHSWNAHGIGEYSARRGLVGSVGVERKYSNIKDTFGVQNWSVAAGVGTSSEDSHLCGAVRGEVDYGSKTTQAFTRAAVGACGEGLQHSTEIGVRHNVGQYVHKDFSVFGEAGVRVGNGGSITESPTLSIGKNEVTPFIGTSLNF